MSEGQIVRNVIGDTVVMTEENGRHSESTLPSNDHNSGRLWIMVHKPLQVRLRRATWGDCVFGGTRLEIQLIVVGWTTNVG